MKKNRGPNQKPDPLDEIRQHVENLNLTAIKDHIPELIEQAQQQSWSYSDFALQMLRYEVQIRFDRRLTRNLKRSGLPRKIEGIRGFDFSIRPKLEAKIIKELHNCRWVDEDGCGRNILCVGRPGLGKTRILDSLCHVACLRGHSVRKIQTTALLEELHASHVDGSYRKTLRKYARVGVLFMDDFGYEAFDSFATAQLFRIVSARHRQKPTLLAASTGFKNWSKLFPSEEQAVATVDRLIDRATILRFTGKTCRKPKAIHGAETDC